MFIIIAIVAVIVFALAFAFLADRSWFPVMTKVAFTIVFSILTILTATIVFWIFSDISFMPKLIGLIIGVAPPIIYMAIQVDKCPHCGAWSSYEDVERFNEKSGIGMAIVEDKKEVYDNNNNHIGTIKGGFKEEKKYWWSYDVLCKCNQCGAERIEHRHSQA